MNYNVLKHIKRCKSVLMSNVCYELNGVEKYKEVKSFQSKGIIGI